MKLNFSIFALASMALQRCFSSGPMAANDRGLDSLIITPGSLSSDPGFNHAKAGVIYAANETELSAAWRSGNVIEAANDGNLAAGTMALSQPLTQFSTGIRDRENLQEILDRLCPMAAVGGLRFSYLSETESEEMQKREIAQLARPVNGEFAETKITGSVVDGAVDNLGIITYLDIDQGGLVPEMQQAVVQSRRNLILRSLIADALAKIDAAATADTSKNWGDAAANPDGNIREMVKNCGDARGEDANVVVLGQGAGHYRMDAYEVPTRTNGSEHGGWTMQRLAEYLQVDDVLSLKARYRSSATAAAALLGAKVYAYNARSGLMPMDSSNVKRFQHIATGGAMRVWIEVGTHRVKIIVDCYARNVVTSTVGLRKRTITWS
ncbi:MAG: hypothetical protein K9N47_05560 [Prosthecobacter sp.]|uniref:hypothetical protein n=1 Tax=Prosthecobacter sp. TaxID=1965333 RepID=UPI0025D5D18A|nr:hypothetical protein [Prosthecobacter sp.]MCF7785567.1 hypothetical protein [Prosthecobacter sp.]